MKNKVKFSVLGLALVAMTITGCNNENGDPIDKLTDNITDIQLDRFYASMFYSDNASDGFNEEIQLNAKCLPKKPGPRVIYWSSSDEKVATVDENGKVKAVGEGACEIKAANAEDTVSASTHIVVNNMNEVKISHCASRLDDIMATQEKSNFVVPDTVTTYESYDRTVEKNGSIISRTKFLQTIQASKDNAYLSLSVDEVDWKCEGGSPVVTSMTYTFYTTDQYESFLFKSEGNTKNYMSVNQSDYIGKGKLEALKAVCDNFFVSGSSIITECFDNILMSQVGSGWLGSSKFNKHYGRMSDVPGQLAFDYYASDVTTADSTDEDDMNIPTGSQYKMTVYDRILFENFYCTGKYIEQTAEYEIGEDKYVDKVIVDDYFKAGEELVYPNKDNYSLVDSIFSL